MKNARMGSVTEDGTDRINDLHDEILCHIFSYLPTEDGERACFVCKRWEFLWSPLSVIDVDYDRFCRSYNDSSREDKRKRFSAFVKDTLSLTWESLTVMKLDCFEFDPLQYGEFKLLHTIVFKSVRLPGSSLCELVEQCPILEELQMIDCSFPLDDHYFSFDAPETLKCLVLDFPCGYEGEFDKVSISASSVSKFVFTGDMVEQFDVGYLPNLVEAEVLLFDAMYSLDSCIMIHNLIGSFSEAQTLSLSGSFFQLLSTYAYEPSDLDEDVQPSFHNLKNLTLRSSLGDLELIGLHRFLRSCPHVETFTIILSPGEDYQKEFWEKQLVPFIFFNHLKKLEIKSFYGLRPEMAFMKYMLENAFVLKKMVIYKAEPRIKSEPDEDNKRSFQEFQQKAFEEVLSFKRASPDVEILLQ